MKKGAMTIVFLVAMVWPAGLVMGQAEPVGREWLGFVAATGMGASHPAGGEALQPWSSPPRAGTGAAITVTTADDELNADGDCSLREAVQAANIDDWVDACVAGSGHDTILLPAGTYMLAIPGRSEDENQTGDLDILDNLSVTGAGAETTILDGGRLDRVLHVHPGRTVEISDATVTGGFLEDSSGAGILNSSGILTLDSVILRHNEVVKLTINVGGAGLGTGGYTQDAMATLNNCLVTENTSWGGGGILNSVSSGLAAQVVLNDTTISGNTAEFGGGIWHTRTGDAVGATSTMMLNGSVVEDNTATVDLGGGIAAYQHGDNVMTLSLSNSVISGNSAVVQGGGVAILGFDAVPVLTLDHSTISGNVAQGVGLYTGRGGGLWVQHSELLVSESTVSGNIAGGAGFASGHGGGMFIVDSQGEMVNSTVSGNEVLGSGLGDVSGLGGGIITVGEVEPVVLNLTNTTVAGNSSNVGGGGIANAFFGADATTTFKNSLVGGNSAPPGFGPSCYNTDQFGGQGTLLSLGHNLEDYDTCEFDEPTDWPNTDPLLGPLGDHGGRTETHLLLTGSPAVDAGDDSASPPTDQRGVPRPQGPATDIGAYEAEAMYASGFRMRYRERDGRCYLVVAITRILTQELERLPDGDVQGVWTLPNGEMREQWATSSDRGLARFGVGTYLTGVHEFCVTGLVKDGYTYDPSLGPEPCSTIEVP